MLTPAVWPSTAHTSVPGGTSCRSASSGPRRWRGPPGAARPPRLAVPGRVGLRRQDRRRPRLRRQLQHIQRIRPAGALQLRSPGRELRGRRPRPRAGDHAGTRLQLPAPVRPRRERLELPDLSTGSPPASSGGKCCSRTSRSTSRIDRCWAAQATLILVWRAFGSSSVRRERGSYSTAAGVVGRLPSSFAIAVVPQSIPTFDKKSICVNAGRVVL